MAFKPKACVDCGNEFEPRSGSQVRCLECRKTHVSPSQTKTYRRTTKRASRARQGKPSRNMPAMTIGPADPTRGRDERSRGAIERIGNTELGSRLRSRMSEIEQESFARFQKEKADGDV